MNNDETKPATPLAFTHDDTEAIFWGDHPDFDPDPVHSEMTDQRRWGHDEERVYRHAATGRHFSVCMYIMSGDADNHEPNGDPVEVWAHEKTVVVWKTSS